MSNQTEAEKKQAILQLCRGIFDTGNLVGTDFDDVRAFEVISRNFPQRHDGAGLHISFSISWNAIGKIGEGGHNALDKLLPKDYQEDNR